MTTGRKRVSARATAATRGADLRFSRASAVVNVGPVRPRALAMPRLKVTPGPGALSINRFGPVPHAKSYTARHCDVSGHKCSPPVKVRTSGYRFTGLAGATTYSIRLVAVGDGLWFTNSRATAALGRPPAGPLAAPVFSLTPGGGSMTVNPFKAVPNASSYSAQLCGGDGANCLSGLTVTTAGTTFSGLIQGTAYSVTVTAIGDGVHFLNSAPTSHSAVAAPTPLAAPALLLAPGPGSVILKPFAEVPNASSYAAQLCDGSGSNCQPAITVTTAGTTFGGLTVGTTYTITLTAIGDGIHYLNSSTVSQTAAAGPTVTAVTAGMIHSCALLSDGTVDCWGNNGNGQLGNGTTANSSTPVPVSGLQGATAISASELHSCALLSGGTVDCWGANLYGELGNNTTANSSTPVPVTGLQGATAVAAGSLHSCALLSDGTVDCWGNNAEGQLGNGTTANSSTPVPVSGLQGATAVTAGRGHSCALLSDGTVDCWGANLYGELGNNTTANSSTPVPVTGLQGATAVTAGNDFTCALLSGGTVDCWGVNVDGELGNNTTANSSTPVLVTGLQGAIAISSSPSHSCALLSGGTVDCWGADFYADESNPTIARAPVPVAGLQGATAVAAGSFHSCALLSGGTVDCWGYNFFGELGNGTATGSPVPVSVIGLP